MSYTEWKDKTEGFRTIDVRGIAWNQGIGYFSSEIGPSTLFAAYKTIKNMEKLGKGRDEICGILKEKFGEKNPDVRVG